MIISLALFDETETWQKDLAHISPQRNELRQIRTSTKIAAGGGNEEKKKLEIDL